RAASFLDYTIVSTGEVHEPELVHIATPTDANPEGFKGAGESGTIPAPAAISNAVEDALRKRKPDAVVDRLPITSDRIVEILGSYTCHPPLRDGLSPLLRGAATA